MFTIVGQVADVQTRVVKGDRKIVSVLVRDPIDGGVLPVQWWPGDTGEVLAFGDTISVKVRGVEAFNRSAHLVAADISLVLDRSGNGHGEPPA